MSVELAELNKMVQEGVLYDFDESLERIRTISDLGFGVISQTEARSRLDAVDESKQRRRKSFIGTQKI